MIATVLVLLVVAGATALIAAWPARREAVAVAAAVLLMAVGHGVGFLPADRALGAISLPVLAIIVAIGIFAAVFAASGAFERACRGIAILAGGDRRRLVPAFLVLTYVLSALLPNLTCLLVLLPLMIGALRAVGMGDDALRRTVVALVIASNLGGASTMIGDFPNILISRSQGIPFTDFLLWMAPPCLVMLGLLIAVAGRVPVGEAGHPVDRLLLVAMVRQRATHLRVDLRLFVPAAACFAALIAALVASGWWPAPPELLCLGAALLLVWCLPRPQDWLARIDTGSLLVIASLFVFAGAIQATGALDALAATVIGWCGEDPYRLSAALILLAAGLTAAFSAGPTTAVLIPVAQSLGAALPGHVEWWSLSLGVLAGSSATLLSATAGPIAAAVLAERTGLQLGYGTFLRLGVPACLVFTVIGIAAIWLRLWMQG
jgi:Na+/H+ antiporter NhaD/arsenite permease-like protein